MTSGTGTKRLGKVAREFNVGITTMVEFLTKKGRQIDSNPNAKIDDDQYALLQKEYSSDVSLKKESEKINLRTQRHQKNESITIDDIGNTDENDDDDDVADESNDSHMLRVTDSNTKKTVTVTEKKNKPFEELVSHTPKKEVKIIGKIDLDRKPKPAPEVPIAETPVKTEKPAPQPVQPAPAAKPEEKIAEKPVERREEKPIVKPEQKPEQKAEPVINTIKDQPVKTNIEKTHVEPKVEKPVAETKVESNQIETKIPKVTNDVKVVGRIDLNTINQLTRPPKKSKKQREDERRARNKPKADASANKEVKKTEPTAADSAQAAADKKRRKRKRIKKERVDINSNNNQAAAPNATSPDNRNRPHGQGQGQGHAQGQSHGQGQGQRPQGKFAHKRPIKHEVSEVDVSKQVKETLARLTNKTKSKGAKYRRDKRAAYSEKVASDMAHAEADQRVIKVTEFVSVSELATMMDINATQVISTCMSLGMFVSINQRLDAETLVLVAEEFGYKVEFISAEVLEAIEETKDNEDDLLPRPPIVTVMGHVDHGKTLLLDYIRNANVVAGEAGGITQHIGAYNVELDNGKKITFLDTPGHEAFTAMRARGAQVTDIAIIIIAADDNVMPQTVEAINHASAAGVPIVFAINKIDKPTANPEAIKERLANMNYLVESWGGKYQSQDISSKSGVGIAELLEKVLLEAEMLELKANPNKNAIGSIIESSLDKGRGYVSTILVQNGTLREGDILLAGQYMGHVKAMFNERGNRIKEAGPAEPALVLGLNGAPQAGDKFNVMETEREARQIANKREQLQREQGMRTQKHITLDEIGRRIAIGNFQELNVIVKGDVDGSIEALSDSLIKLSTPEIQVNIKHKAVGQISESDVMLASASDAIIVGFQVRPSLSARKIAEQEQIDIRLYSIIYDAIEEIRAAMEGMLSPEIKEEIVGTAEIREVYKITKVGTVAGCLVRDGKIIRNNKVRLIRDGIVIYTGDLGSLKRFKDDQKEVKNGYECGMNINGYNDLQVGDTIESFTTVEVAKKL